jgi:TRAP-type C4-dicarboxylate transport system permease small subunit
MASLDRFSALAARYLYNIGVFGALPALFLLVTIDVVLRYAFNAPLQWGRDANGLLLLITLFSALPYAWDKGFHIRMEIVHARLSTRWRSLADVVSAMAGIFFFALLSIQALMFSRYMFQTRETGEDLSAPLWPFMVFVAISGAIFSLRLLANPSIAAEPEENSTRKWI